MKRFIDHKPQLGILKWGLFIIILFNVCNLSHGQEPYNISINGKNYLIEGNDLIIIVGKNPNIKITNRIPEKVKEGIKKKYDAKIIDLKSRFQKGEFVIQILNDSIEYYNDLKNVASEQARLLSEEFATTDFSQQSYIYRLAYIVYDRYGDIDGALAILNDESLEDIEYQQALKYILLIDSYIEIGESFATIDSLFNVVSHKYPYPFIGLRYADYLFREGKYERAISYYDHQWQNETQDSIMLAKLSFQLAKCALAEENFDEVSKWTNEAIKYHSLLKKQDQINLLVIWSDLNQRLDPNNALSYYGNAIVLLEDSINTPHSDSLLAIIHSRIGTIHFRNDSFSKAILHFSNCFAYFKKKSEGTTFKIESDFTHLVIMFAKSLCHENQFVKANNFLTSLENKIYNSTSLEDQKKQDSILEIILTHWELAIRYGSKGEKKDIKKQGYTILKSFNFSKEIRMKIKRIKKRL